ncbi:hypothetical protein Tco_1271255 [Tanacetum coccineum]
MPSSTRFRLVSLALILLLRFASVLFMGFLLEIWKTRLLLGVALLQIKNIEGKMMEKDGKPMKAIRNIHFAADTIVPGKGDANHVAYDHECVESNIQVATNGSPKKTSFAAVLQDNTTKKTVKIFELHNDEVVEGAAVAIPIKAVEEVSSRFVNTLYGYFIGKRLAFPLVENYVKNTWAKFGLERAMLHHGFFFFQFATQEGMERGRNSYSRALIEISSKKELMESLVIAIPFPNENGHTLETVDVEYEWEPPRCATCKNFDHNDEQCPKKVKEAIKEPSKDDGFTQVIRKRTKNMNNPTNRQVQGIKLTKPKLNLAYRHVVKPTNEDSWESSKPLHTPGNDSDSDVEELILEEPHVHKDAPKQSEVCQVINENALSVCAILESHVASFRIDFLCSRVFRSWSWTSNGSFYAKGSWIILGWNPNDVDIVMITQDA